MRNIFYLMQKEFRQVFRQPVNLMIIFVMPFIQLVILGFAITLDVKNISMTLVDQDHSAASRQIMRSFNSGDYFRLQPAPTSVADAVQMIDQGQSKLVVVIPEQFEDALIKAETPALQIILDGVDGNTAGITMGYVSTIALGLQQKWLPQIPDLARQSLAVHLVNPQPRMLYNPNLESASNIVPGVLVVLLTMVTLFLTAVNIVREKEIGTLEQILVTPIRKTELILGKVLPFTILGFVMLNVGILAAGLIFHIWLTGNLFTLYLLAIIFMFSTQGIGILISTISHNQQQAMFYAFFFAIFAILLSGFFIPIENMPDIVQKLTYLNPLRYFMVVIRGIYLKGATLVDLLPQLLCMVIYSLLTFSIAINKFHKRLQ
jgi:ABC-2 type transport system permease protein